jgi:hypothetical protein
MVNSLALPSVFRGRAEVPELESEPEEPSTKISSAPLLFVSNRKCPFASLDFAVERAGLLIAKSRITQ